MSGWLQCRGGAATTEHRHGAQGGLRRAVDQRLDVGGDGRLKELTETVGGILRRGGGLERQRLLLGVSLGGAGGMLSLTVSILGRLTGDSERRRNGEFIN